MPRGNFCVLFTWRSYLGKAGYPASQSCPGATKKSCEDRVTSVRPCTEAKLTPGSVSCPGIMWTGPKIIRNRCNLIIFTDSKDAYCHPMCAFFLSLPAVNKFFRVTLCGAPPDNVWKKKQTVINIISLDRKFIRVRINLHISKIYRCHDFLIDFHKMVDI